MEFAVDDVVEIFPGRIGQDILPARVEIPVIAHGFRQGDHLAFAEFFVGDGRVQIRDFPVPSGALAAAENRDTPFVDVQEHAVRGVGLQQAGELGQPMAGAEGVDLADVLAHLCRHELGPRPFEVGRHGGASLSRLGLAGAEPQNVIGKTVHQGLRIRLAKYCRIRSVSSSWISRPSFGRWFLMTNVFFSSLRDVVPAHGRSIS